MIDKNEKDIRPETQPREGRQTADPRPKQDKILRAKDIIPGAERGGNFDEGAEAAKFDIPRFNLAQDIMSAQRRQNAVRRKGPEAAEDGGGDSRRSSLVARDSKRENTEYRIQNTEQRTKKAGSWLAGGIETLRDSIIAEIVAGDIERFCVGH